jgi:hypothetical protein
MQYAPDFARFYITARGPYDAVKMKPDIIRAAAERDRDMCTELAVILPKPVPPMRTFLAMVGISAYADWVDVCQRVFPPDEWVLRAGDQELIRTLPGDHGMDEIHRIAIERVNAMKPEVPDEILGVEESQYHFQAPEVIQIDAGIRVSEPPTLANLRAFLWHTGTELPAGFSVDVLEEIVARFGSDARLLAGFLLWADKNGHRVDATKWAGLIRIERWDLDAILAVAALLLHVAAPVPASIRALIEVGCAALGVSYTPDGVLALLKRVGVPWLFARNVLLVAPPDWSIRPLTLGWIRDDPLAIKEDLSLDDPRALLVAAGEILCEPPSSSLWQFDLLPNYKYPSRVLQYFGLPTIPAQREISDAVIDAIIAALEPLKPISLEWLHLFAEIKLDDVRLQRIQTLFAFANRPQPDLVFIPTLFRIGGRLAVRAADGTLDADFLTFFSGRPPSFTRFFVRALSSIILPLGMRPFVQDIVPLLAPVWPPLCYADSSFYGIKMWPFSLPFSLFQCGRLSGEIGRGLLSDLKAPSHEAVVICETLLTVPEANLKVVMPWVAGSVNETLLSTIIETAVAPSSHVVYATAIIRTLVDLCPPERLMVLLCNKDFVNQPNFPCVCVMFRHFQRKVGAQGQTAIADYCLVFQDPELGMFRSQLKTRIFGELSNPENTALLLHSNTD